MRISSNSKAHHRIHINPKSHEEDVLTYSQLRPTPIRRATSPAADVLRSPARTVPTSTAAAEEGPGVLGRLVSLTEPVRSCNSTLIGDA
jgi:hypothetical protein